MPPAAAMSWRSPPTTSCWSTTAARRWRCRRRRCSPCCPAPAVSRASPTSARCGATAPTCSARSRRASAAPRRSTGGWSTRWCRIRNGRRRWPRARTRSPRAPTGRRTPKAFNSRRSRARSRATACPIRTSTSRSTATRGLATVTVRGPTETVPSSIEAAHALGAKFWPLTVARELEDAILHLRTNEAAIAVVLFRTDGNAQAVLEHDDFLAKANGDWLMREIRHYLKRVLKRVDVTPKSFIALIEPGSCFAGTLAELAFAADRSLMLIGTREGDNRKPAAITLGAGQFRLLSDGQRADAPADALPRRAGAGRHGQGKDRPADRRRGSRRARPRHRGLRRLRLGRRTARSCWRSARASRPTP